MPQHDILTDKTAKALGTYYTDAQVADFLVWWAVRGSADTVLDPSVGGGVFLLAACRRLKLLGGSPCDQVFGVELDERVYQAITSKLRQDFAITPRHLVCSDFFAIERPVNTPVDVVVGNPRLSGTNGLPAPHANVLDSKWSAPV